MLGRRGLLTAAGIGVIASVLPLEAMADDELAPFLGTFKFSGGEKEQKALDKAIDGVVSQMNLLVRGMARDKLKQANPIATNISFASDANILTVTFDSRTYTAPLDGTPVKIKSILGDDMMLSYKVMCPGEIQQLFSGDDKGRANHARVDGTTCTVDVRVYSSKLPHDLVYSLTYSKV